jgi:hypothetical protein
VADGTPVFEAWFWHRLLRRWFCMSTVHHPALIQQGVVFFQPGDLDGLKRSMHGLEQAAGVVR